MVDDDDKGMRSSNRMLMDEKRGIERKNKKEEKNKAIETAACRAGSPSIEIIAVN